MTSVFGTGGVTGILVDIILEGEKVTADAYHETLRHLQQTVQNKRRVVTCGVSLLCDNT